MRLQLAVFFVTSSLFKLISAKDDGLARTPPMGWNSWNSFGCNINADMILGNAESLIDAGLDKLGYEYIVIDDCWHAPSRDPNPPYAPRADENRFRIGIKALADEIHEMGLKLGIYSSAGTMTCAKQFGSLGYEEIDAQTYKEWGVDYVKYDNCYNEGQAGYDLVSYNRYAKMSHALNATGRPMVYAMCNWGEDGTWNWAPTIAHTWRMSGDIMDSYDEYDDRCPCESAINCKLPGFHCSMMRILEYAAPLVQKAGPGQWNDLDMLEVGNGGMTTIEYQTHFSMWALIKSPLILGNRLWTMDAVTLAIISNKLIIAMNQDALGMPVNRVKKTLVKNRQGEVEGNVQIWSGPLVDGAVVGIVNTSPVAQTISYSIAQVYPAARGVSKKYKVLDAWGLKDSSLGIAVDNWGKWLDGDISESGLMAVDIPAHGTVVHKWLPLAPGLSGTAATENSQKVMKGEL